jgi:hypothetical protein
MSRVNIHPSCWGNAAWTYFYSIAWAYPERNPSRQLMEDVRATFVAPRSVCGCSKCRRNHPKHLRESPLTDNILKSRWRVFKWLVDLDNAVNAHWREPMTYDEAIEMCARKFEYPKTVSNTTIAITIIVTGAVGWAIYKRLQE